MSTDTPQPQEHVQDDSKSVPSITVTDHLEPSPPEQKVDEITVVIASGESPVPESPKPESSKPELTAPPEVAPAANAADVSELTVSEITITETVIMTSLEITAEPVPTPETQSESELPKRKFQLNPTSLSGDSAVPTKPNQAGTHLPPRGPVELPSAHDEDVEAEIAKAISGMSESVVSASGDVGNPEVPVAMPAREEIDASIEAAIEAAMSGSNDDPSVLSPSTDPDEIKQGTKLSGTVQSIHGDNVFLDLGLRLTGVVPFRQFEKNPPKEGDVIEVAFNTVNEEDGLIQVNLPRSAAVVTGGDWSAISVGQVVEVQVTKVNKGGLEVKVGDLRGFMPASQVDSGFVEDLATFVGQKLKAKITEVKPGKKRLIVSRRKIQAEEREVLKKDLLEELATDQIRTGTVKSIKDFGVFIDLGGMDGFLPISQMSWVRIDHPSELVKVGQEIEVKVLSIDQEKGKVSLGTRQLSPNPWRAAEAKYPKGSTSNGRVSRIEAFGAFVELEPGIEGLINISELDHRRVKSVSEVLKQDDVVNVQILEVDPAKKRISLSMKALLAKPEPKEVPEEPELPAYERTRKGPLKGGTSGNLKGGLFGDPGAFGSK